MLGGKNTFYAYIEMFCGYNALFISLSNSVMFKNEDNGYIVLMLDYAGEPVTVVGELGDIDEGEELTLTGEYQSHPKFGMQFHAFLCERALPSTAAQIQKYLSSGVIGGIGAVLAKKIVKEYYSIAGGYVDYIYCRMAYVKNGNRRSYGRFDLSFSEN